jgi:hypothetical protein
MLNAKSAEALCFEVGADVWMLRALKKRPEVDNLRGAIVECQPNPEIANLIGRYDIDDDRVHFSLLVMRSGLTGL